MTDVSMGMTDMGDDYSFLDLMNNLMRLAENTPRWQGKSGERETLLRHSYNIAMLAMFFLTMECKLNPKVGKKINLAKLLAYALLHDVISEGLMGDIITILKYDDEGLNAAIKKIEESVANDFQAMIGALDQRYGFSLGAVMKTLIKLTMSIAKTKAKGKQPVEYRFFKAVEMLDQMYQAVKIHNTTEEHIWRGVRRDNDWWLDTVVRLKEYDFKAVLHVYLRDLNDVVGKIIRQRHPSYAFHLAEEIHRHAKKA